MDCSTDIAVGDIVRMKKKHPCGESLFRVMRIGMDFKLRCEKCQREIMMPRKTAEKNIKEVRKQND